MLLQIRRQSGANTVEVVKAVEERLAELNADRPPGYTVQVVRGVLADRCSAVLSGFFAEKRRLRKG